MLFLSAADLESLGLTVSDTVEVLRPAYAEYAHGRATMPPKSWIVRDPETWWCAMQCYLPSLGAAGCKWNIANPGGAARGLPYVQGLYVLSDAATGSPVAIMDSAWLTNARTGAAVALAARLLARPGAADVAVLGCGVQGRGILTALREVVPGLRAARAYDIHEAAAARYAAEMSRRLDLEVTPAATPYEAVRAADLVLTAGPNTRSEDPIRLEWLAPGALGISVNRDAFWAPEAVAAMEIVADDAQQIDELKSGGFFHSVSGLYAELADVVAGRRPGRPAPGARVLLFKLGLALEDLATAVELYRRARERGVGTRLTL